LTPERLAKLADTFQRDYRDRFKTEPPSTLKGFERQRWELLSLDLPPEVLPRLVVVVGAVEGEYAVRRHGARWHLAKGPLNEVPQTPLVQEGESLFGYVANPFEAVNCWDRAGSVRDPDTYVGQLSVILTQAAGRTLVLANNRAAGQAGVAALIDPDLARGT